MHWNYERGSISRNSSWQRTVYSQIEVAANLQKYPTLIWNIWLVFEYLTFDLQEQPIHAKSNVTSLFTILGYTVYYKQH